MIYRDRKLYYSTQTFSISLIFQTIKKMDDNNVTIKKEPKAEPTGRFTFNYRKI